MNVALVPGELPATATPLPQIVLGNQNQKAAAPVTAQPPSSGPAEPAPAQGSTAQQKPAYPPPAETPTQEAGYGLRFDFNSGCRVLLPDNGKPWKVQISDQDTGNILFQTELKEGRVNSSKRYYARFRLEVWQDDQSVVKHEYDATNREVLIQFPVGTLGDTLGWFPYAAKFKEKHIAS